jgi:hypothetical protein
MGFNAVQTATMQQRPGVRSSESSPYHTPPAVTTHPAMERINAHYMADKQALARSDDSAASNSKQSGSARPGGAGNKIRKGIDELFNEFINKMEHDM